MMSLLDDLIGVYNLIGNDIFAWCEAPGQCLENFAEIEPMCL